MFRWQSPVAVLIAHTWSHRPCALSSPTPPGPSQHPTIPPTLNAVMKSAPPPSSSPSPAPAWRASSALRSSSRSIAASSHTMRLLRRALSAFSFSARSLSDLSFSFDSPSLSPSGLASPSSPSALPPSSFPPSSFPPSLPAPSASPLPPSAFSCHAVRAGSRVVWRACAGERGGRGL